MKLIVASVLLALLAVCADSAEEPNILSSSINYVQEVASDVASKATDALNSVKELPLAQQAMSLYDTGAEYVSSAQKSVMDFLSETWGQVTKSFSKES